MYDGDLTRIKNTQRHTQIISFKVLTLVHTQNLYPCSVIVLTELYPGRWGTVCLYIIINYPGSLV